MGLYNYATEEDANRVLEYFEHLLTRSMYVIYIAVVRLDDSMNESYKLEIGVNPDGNISFVDKPPSEVLDGKFNENEIPNILPIPPKYNFAKRENNAKKKIVSGNNYLEHYILTEKAEAENIKIKSPTDKLSTTTLDWFTYRYGGQPIYSENLMGTLGGIFSLTEFPDKLFGITNWHSFSKKRLLGEDIFSDRSRKNKIGNSFWMNVSNQYESGFIEIDDCIGRLLRLGIKNKKGWPIVEPQIGFHVEHNGFGTFGNQTTQGIRKSTIHSRNATVRVYNDYFDNQSKIFTNQILIKNFSTDGDSGAIVLMRDQDDSKSLIKAIGLLFAVTGVVDLGTKKYFQMSIANNLNFITSEKKQEVFAGRMSSGRIKTKLSKNLKFKNDQLY